MPGDLDRPGALERFIEAFYRRLLQDPLLSPLFLDVAGIDLAVHLPRIKAYWRKMLFADPAYQRHMMARHRAVHARVPFHAEHYQRWLRLFEETLAEEACGPVAERAERLARRVAGNMRRNLAQFPGQNQ